MNYSLKNTIMSLTLLELDLDKEITVDQVRSQYRKLCKIYHPDVSDSRYNDGNKFMQLSSVERYLIDNIDKINKQIRDNPPDDSDSNSTKSDDANYADNDNTNQKNNIKKHNFIWPAIIVISVVVVIYAAVNLVISQRDKTSSNVEADNQIATPEPSVDTSLPLPNNGKVFYCEHSDKYSTLSINNKGNDNYYLKLVDFNGNKVFSGFVRANSKYDFEIPTKTLELRLSCGDKWYGEGKLFNNNYRAKDPEPYYFSMYTYQLEFKTLSDLGEKIHLEQIPIEDF